MLFHKIDKGGYHCALFRKIGKPGGWKGGMMVASSGSVPFHKIAIALPSSLHD